MHKLKLQFIFISLILVFQIRGYSQANFEEGFMISNTGDTISGWIDFRDWITGPFTIEFKSDLSLPSLKLNARTIQGFSVHDQYYTSLHVLMDISPDDPNSILYGPVRKLRDDIIFARIYIESYDGLNLYFYADENGKKHFFCNQADSIAELRQVTYIDTAKSSIVIISEWIITLMNLTASCPDAMDKTSPADFTLESIVAIIDDYNDCMNFESLNYSIKEEKKSLFGICGGISSAQLVYQSDVGGEYYATANYSAGPGFTAGIFYDIDLPHKRESWWISSNIIFHKFNSTGVYDSENSLNIQHNEISFQQLDFKLSSSIKLQMNTSPFKAYIKAGPAISRALLSTNKTITVTTNKYTLAVDSISLENDIQKNIFHFSGTISGGINWNNKLFLELGFERGFHLEDYAGVDAFENDLYACVYFVLN